VIVAGTAALLVTGGSDPSPAPADPSLIARPSPVTPTPAPAWVPEGPLPACQAPGDEEAPDTPQARPAQVVREVSTQGSRVGRPAGISYSSAGDLMMLFPEPPDSPAAAARPASVGMMTLYGDGAGSVDIPTPIRDPIDAAFDGVGKRLLVLDPARSELATIPASETGVPESTPETVRLDDLRPLRLGPVTGSAVDPVDGALYLLDSGGPRIVRIDADRAADGRTVPALRDGGVCVISLAGIGELQLRGLAADSATGHLFVLGVDTRQLFELDLGGRLHVIHDLGPVGLEDPRAMTFGPSGDPTEAPSLTSLYVLDHVERANDSTPRDRILEVDLREIPSPFGPAPASDVHGVLLQTIQTSEWTPVSSDPSGLAYLPGRGILVTDAEIDETPSFDRANLFQASPDGTVLGSSLTSFSEEPAGVAVDSETGTRFVSDDVLRRVFVVQPGPDSVVESADDEVSSFDTTAYGSFDPEGLAFGNGTLFVSDGLGAEIFRILAGSNGVFDGVAPTGDDQVTSFDTRTLGQPTPEGLEYVPESDSLFVVSNDTRANLLEVATDGRPIRVIDLSFLNAFAPAGLAYGPGSAVGTPSLFIADRGRDNSQNPAENDGRIYEIRIVRGGPPNLVANPGFEVDEDGDGGIDLWDGAPGASLATDRARSGSVSLRIEAPATGVVVDQRLPSMDGGRNYTFAMWVDVPPTRSPISLKVRIRWRNAARANLGTQKITAVEGSTAGWDKVVTSFRAPAGVTNAILTFALEGEGTVVYLDDILLIPIR
jgi:DNA-binding beta-propeller fold protein YncE